MVKKGFLLKACSSGLRANFQVSKHAAGNFRYVYKSWRLLRPAGHLRLAVAAVELKLKSTRTPEPQFPKAPTPFACTQSQALKPNP